MYRGESWDRDIELGERIIEGLISPADLPPWERVSVVHRNMKIHHLLTHPDPQDPAQCAAFLASGFNVAPSGEVTYGRPDEALFQKALLRDVVGPLPFRALCLDSRLVSTNVHDLAHTIYDERAFDRLPILADALMDAGCDDADILGHCRSEGPHVRGCWVVDLVLGKA
jgi:hypothetical protein